MTVISNEEFSLRRAVREGKVAQFPTRESIIDTFKSAFGIGSEEKAKEALRSKHQAIGLNWLAAAIDEIGSVEAEKIVRMLHEHAMTAREFDQ